MAAERFDIVVTENGARKVRRELGHVADKARRTSDSVSFLRNTLLTLGSAGVLRSIVAMADQFQNLQNRLNLVTSSAQETEAVTQRLFEAANRSRGAFENLGEMYSRIALSTRHMNVSQQELINMVETLNKAIILSGASVREGNQAMIQFTQGLASGALRGDELRAVLEQLPFVADLIAKELGTTRGALRAFGAQGRITTEVMVAAFRNAGESIDGHFGNTLSTISQALLKFRNHVLMFVADLNKSTGATATLVKILDVLGKNFTFIGRVVLGTLFVAGALKATSAMIALTVAIAANPIGAIAVAVTAAVIALVALADQLKLSQDGVATLQDYFEATFEFAVDGLRAIAEVFEEEFQFIADLARNVFGDVEFSIAGVLTAAARFADRFIGVYVGAFKAIVAAFNHLPAAFRDIFTRALNGAIQIVESGVNRISGAVNKILDFVGAGQIGAVSLGRIQNAAEGGAADLGAAVGDAFLEGFNANHIEGTVNAILDRAESNARDRMARQARERAERERALADLETPSIRGEEGETFRDAMIRQTLMRVEGEARALRESNAERAVQNELLNLEIRLMRRGVELKEEEKGAILDRLREIQIIKDQAAVYQEIRGHLEDVARAQVALNALYAEGAITLEEYLVKQRELRLAALEKDRTVFGGFERGLLRLEEQITDFGAMAENTLVNAFNNAEDAFVHFVQSGEFNFSKLVDSILADLTRLMARQLLMKALGMFVPGAGAADMAMTALGGARAEGGPVSPGKAYLVGERGPEIFQPGAAGTIVPNEAIGGEPPQVNVTVVNVDDPEKIASAMNDPKIQELIVNVIGKHKAAVNRQLGIR